MQTARSCICSFSFSFSFSFTMSHEKEDHPPPSRASCDLCSRIIDILKIPQLPLPTLTSGPSSANSSPAVFASLFIGISLALILFGAITLLIGFLLMPVVISLLLLFYFFQLLSLFSNFVRSLVPLHSPKDVSAVPAEDSFCCCGCSCCCCSIPPLQPVPTT